MINSAKKPIIYAGQGVANADATNLLRQLADKAQIPCTTTLQGLGVFDELDPKSLHMLGMHGAAYANHAMQTADLIIAIGARFDDRVTGKLDHFARAARRASAENEGGIIQFDVSSKNINKTVSVDLAVAGDALSNLQQLMPLIEERSVEEPLRAAWFSQCQGWKDSLPYYVAPISEEEKKIPFKMKPQRVLEEANKQTAPYSENVIWTTGVGQHQMWAAQFIRWRHPRSMITSGGLGTMGFGMPAAIGAKLACPNKMVIDVDGDASWCMTGMELMTASQYGVNVKILLLNNNFQGMVKQWQDLFYHERYSGTEMTNPDFIKLAESMHVKAIRCETEEELPAKMKEFLEYNDGPVLFEACVEKHEHVYPMVASGKALDDMVLHPDLEKGIDAKAVPAGL
jgi:acetolactate synthase-1/2/3 large subunit